MFAQPSRTKKNSQFRRGSQAREFSCWFGCVHTRSVPFSHKDSENVSEIQLLIRDTRQLDAGPDHLLKGP